MTWPRQRYPVVALYRRRPQQYAGFPDTVPIRTVNRKRSSGLQAVADVASCIKAGFYDVGIGAGLESITIDKVVPEHIRYGVTRQEQEQAAAATVTGKFKDEIVPVFTKIVDPKTGEEKPATISVDDGILQNTNMTDLAKLKPTFKKNGTTTAGNASQVSDGAGAVLLMKRSLAMQKELPILSVFGSFATVGVDPAVMGSSAVAIPAAVKSAGLELDDIDLFEINEFVYSCKKLGFDREKVNVNGGAIALGCYRCSLFWNSIVRDEVSREGLSFRSDLNVHSGMGAVAVFEREEYADELCNARVVKCNNLLSKDCQ
ncbi:hypothetical protein GQ457_15G014620 [Hibiscus cannabinus]